MARLLHGTGTIDMLLVGDSLGMVQLGFDSTLPVTMEDMVRHTRSVRAGAPDAIVIADMPFMSHQPDLADALRNAGRLMAEGGATCIKLEGGAVAAPTVERIVHAGIPVMGHIGLMPQAVHAHGGYRKQATGPEGEDKLLADAVALQAAGAFSLVLEMVTEEAARKVTEKLDIPTIGIGAGPFCDGQVLVTHDMLGLSGDMTPSFVKQYAQVGAAISTAAAEYASEVRSGIFPSTAKRSGHA